MTFRILALLVTFAFASTAFAQADCSSTTWIDDFSVQPALLESINTDLVTQEQMLPNGVERRSLTVSRGAPAGAPPEFQTRHVLERGSSAPLTCWSDSNFAGLEPTDIGGYCHIWYQPPTSAPLPPIPLNGATHWYIITDHIGNDGTVQARASNAAGTLLNDQGEEKFIRHGYNSPGTLWRAPINPGHIAEGAIYYSMLLEWHAKDTVGTNPTTFIEDGRWGILRFGVGPPEGPCIPAASPPVEPSPGPGYSQIDDDNLGLL